MASAFSTTLVHNPSAAAAAAAAAEASLHSANPGPGGTANELSGGGYARQPVTWGTPAGGIVTASADPEFSIPAGWVRWVGLWDSGGNWIGNIELDSPFESPAEGTYTVSPLQLISEDEPTD